MVAMRTRNFCLGCCVAFAAAALISSVAFAQEKKDESKPAVAKPAETGKPAAAKPGDKPGDKGMGGMDPKMMEEMMKVPAEVKQLEFAVGDWDTAVKMRMSADAPWQESKGTSTGKWIMDGRYVQVDHTGDMGGMPFRGMEIVTYDPMKKKYVSTWIDNMGCMILMSEGTFDAAKKAMTWNTEFTCPMDNEHYKVRNVMTVVDSNKHTMQWYQTKPGGKEELTMEITYTRKGAAPAGGNIK
jgi:hypothetical protein